MDEAQRAMSTWIGSLGRGGVVKTSQEEAGDAVAAWVVGEARLGELRAWFAEQPSEVVEREQRAAIEVCIWMAHADRTLEPQERALLAGIAAASGLPEPIKAELRAAIDDPPSLDGLEHRVTHPALRELLVALSWELALTDGHIDRAERDFSTGLARRLRIPERRAEEIRSALTQRLVD